ncbi:MAG: PorP/SprF family type IX secretion system membrane protein [Bacteroidetes bacterium]|nr:PorP/SprF family type IX secretion system membrane protein [Bacteroidota bacterium]
MILPSEKYRFSSSYQRFRRILAVAILTAGFTPAVAQQTSNITHYMFMNMAVNPAFAGSSDGINVTGLVRQQWIGFKDDRGGNTAPQTLFLTIDSPIRFLHGGIGATVVSDKFGPYNNTAVTLGYAYRTDLGPGEISAGLQVNFQNSKLNVDQLEPLVTIPDAGKSDFILDGSLGLFYKVPDKYYVGLSCINVLQTKYKKLLTRDKGTFDLTGGYNWVVPGHPAFELQPSAFITTDLATYSFSISTLLQYNKKVWGGLAYRQQDAISVLAGFNIKAFKVGISYDISVSKMSRYENGSIEVLLNYCFKIETEKFRKSYKNTRFL